MREVFNVYLFFKINRELCEGCIDQWARGTLRHPGSQRFLGQWNFEAVRAVSKLTRQF